MTVGLIDRTRLSLEEDVLDSFFKEVSVHSGNEPLKKMEDGTIRTVFENNLRRVELYHDTGLTVIKNKKSLPLSVFTSCFFFPEMSVGEKGQYLDYKRALIGATGEKAGGKKEGLDFLQDGAVLGCPKLRRKPVIDGKINESFWKRAVVAENFVLLGQDAFAREKTKAMIAYTRDTLYIAFQCFDSRMDKIKANRTKYDSQIWRDDCVEVLIDVNHDSKTYYHFLVNAAGIRADIQDGGPKGRDMKWNAVWQAAAKRSKDSWTVEIAIPFKSIGKVPQPGEIWGFNLAREQKRLANSSWNPTGCFSSAAEFGNIKFLSSSAPVEKIVNETTKTGGSVSIHSKGVGKRVRAVASIIPKTGIPYSFSAPLEEKLTKIPYSIRESGHHKLVVSFLDSTNKLLHQTPPVALGFQLEPLIISSLSFRGKNYVLDMLFNGKVKASRQIVADDGEWINEIRLGEYGKGPRGKLWAEVKRLYPPTIGGKIWVIGMNDVPEEIRYVLAKRDIDNEQKGLAHPFEVKKYILQNPNDGEVGFVFSHTEAISGEKFKLSLDAQGRNSILKQIHIISKKLGLDSILDKEMSQEEAMGIQCSAEREPLKADLTVKGSTSGPTDITIKFITNKGTFSVLRKIDIKPVVSMDISSIQTEVIRIVPNEKVGYDGKLFRFTTVNPTPAFWNLHLKNNLKRKQVLTFEIPPNDWIEKVALYRDGKHFKHGMYRMSAKIGGTEVSLPATIEIKERGELDVRLCVKPIEDSIGIYETVLRVKTGKNIFSHPLKLKVIPSPIICSRAGPKLCRRFGLNTSLYYGINFQRTNKGKISSKTRTRASNISSFCYERGLRMLLFLSLPFKYMDREAKYRNADWIRTFGKELSDFEKQNPGILGHYLFDEPYKMQVKTMNMGYEVLKPILKRPLTITLTPNRNSLQKHLKEGLKTDIIITDPYQSEEQVHRVTSELLEAAKKSGGWNNGKDVTAGTWLWGSWGVSPERMRKESWYCYNKGCGFGYWGMVTSHYKWGVINGVFSRPKAGGRQHEGVLVTERGLALIDIAADMALFSELELRIKKLVHLKENSRIIAKAKELKKEAYNLSQKANFYEACDKLKKAIEICKKQGR